MKQRTILLAVGGTGGHFFPALSVADSLKKMDSSIQIVFAGGGLKSEKYLQNSFYQYRVLSCAPLSFGHPVKMAKNGLKLLKGCREANTLFEKESVSLVVGFGSYYALPVLLAAKWKTLPYILHEQNSIPGRVIRLFSKGAAFTGIHFCDSKKYLKGESRVVGMPLRDGYKHGQVSKEESANYFSLDHQKPILLIFGGSQGASGIHKMLLESLQKEQMRPFQIIHLTGSSNETEKFRSLYCTMGICCMVKDYEEKMELAWSAADCVISRAGASSIAEQIEFEVPGVLIPYPFAMDNHQEANADFFVNHVKGGFKCLENQGTTQLQNTLDIILRPAELKRLKENISCYKKEAKPSHFACEIFDYLNKMR